MGNRKFSLLEVKAKVLEKIRKRLKILKTKKTARNRWKTVFWPHAAANCGLGFQMQFQKKNSYYSDA